MTQKELVTVEEFAISNMWEIAAQVEALEREGVPTCQGFYDAFTEQRRRWAGIPWGNWDEAPW